MTLSGVTHSEPCHDVTSGGVEIKSTGMRSKVQEICHGCLVLCVNRDDVGVRIGTNQNN